MKREPLLTRAGITAAVAAIIALLVAYGVDVDEAQKSAILTVVGIFGPLVAGLFGRAVVTPISDPRDEDGRILVPAAPAADVDPDAPTL